MFAGLIFCPVINRRCRPFSSCQNICFLSGIPTKLLPNRSDAVGLLGMPGLALRWCVLQLSPQALDRSFSVLRAYESEKRNLQGLNISDLTGDVQ